MNPKSLKRTEQDMAKDKVYASLETGNTAWARANLSVYRDTYGDQAAEALRAGIVRDYGVSL